MEARPVIVKHNQVNGSMGALKIIDNDILHEWSFALMTPTPEVRHQCPSEKSVPYILSVDFPPYP